MVNGTKQEINALATLVGKVMPVYYPYLSYREDGCTVLPLNSSYMVVSGDGTSREELRDRVAFEFE